MPAARSATCGSCAPSRWLLHYRVRGGVQGRRTTDYHHLAEDAEDERHLRARQRDPPPRARAAHGKARLSVREEAVGKRPEPRVPRRRPTSPSASTASYWAWASSWRRPRSGRSSRTPASARLRAGAARAVRSSCGPRRRGSWRWTSSPPHPAPSSGPLAPGSARPGRVWRRRRTVVIDVGDAAECDTSGHGTGQEPFPQLRWRPQAEPFNRARRAGSRLTRHYLCTHGWREARLMHPSPPLRTVTSSPGCAA